MVYGGWLNGNALESSGRGVSMIGSSFIVD